MNLFEVFEELQVKKELQSAFLEVEVLKITTSRSTGNTVIHLASKRLLEFDLLNEMERIVSEQFFGRVGKRAKFAVEYQLSSQYTPETLWKMYQESIMAEIGRESRMAAYLLRFAEPEFTEGDEGCTNRSPLALSRMAPSPRTDSEIKNSLPSFSV